MKFYAHSLPDKDKSYWHLLADHLKATGELAGEFASCFGAELLAQQAGLLHDLGKYSSEFQQKLEGDPARVNHSTHGAREAITRFGELGYLLAYAIAGHHTGLANGQGFTGKRKALVERLKDSNLPELSPVWEKEIKLADAQMLKKKLNIKPRKGSEFFQYAFLMRMLFSCLVDADRLDTARFFDKAQAEPRVELSELRSVLDDYLKKFNNDGHNDLYRWRNKILAAARQGADQEPGLFSLTVPTGGGKTLTSLAFALDHAIKYNLRRVIYVIPYTNIIEQTAQVFRDALGVHKDAVLEHHSGFNVDDADLENDHYQGAAKLKLAVENWDCPIIVTTAVQFFESLFAARTTKCRKLHNIANSVVILDEAQTTPLQVLRPCVQALQELALNYRSSIVLCTATQPALGKEKFTDGFDNVRELAPEREQMFKFFKRVTIHKNIAKWTDEELLKKINKHPQLLCIVNNRRHARYLVDNLSDTTGVRLLTTSMCAKHRHKVLKEIHTDLVAGKPCRLVATSLVEAGVDLDFPMVLRAEAGLDSIVQAAGRCNREGKSALKDSEVFVFTTDDKWQMPLELQQAAQVAREVLRGGTDPLAQETITKYFEQLYWQKGDASLDEKCILKMLSESKLSSLPFEEIDAKFVMIAEGQQPIIIAYDTYAKQLLDELEQREHIANVARQLQPYLVQLPQYAYNKMYGAGVLEIVAQERFAKQFVRLLNDDLYHHQYGLAWDDPAFMRADKAVL